MSPKESKTAIAGADPAEAGEAPPLSKGEKTRAHILETALKLFRERGYEQTTMRAIAEEAGVAVGNAYYYFRSKEHLIQAFYAKTHEEHLAASREVLATERDLEARLLGVMRAKLDTIDPYHRFAGILFKTAADPQSPLNPFSEDSREVRAEATTLFAEVVEGSDTRLSPALRAELPELLWLYHMGILLYWIHDASAGAARSRRLVERSVPLIVRVIALDRIPPLRPVIRKLLETIAELREPAAAAPATAASPE
jgi:AcrR family transcriptional regulator